MNPKITKIEKNKYYYKISILKDNELYNFSISEDLLIESKFLSLKEISEAEYIDFINKIPFDSLYVESIKYIAKSPKTRKEIENHLFTLTSSKKLIEECLNLLDDRKLINDFEYFKNILDLLIHTKKEGRLKIDERLKELGLFFEYEYPIEDLKNNIEELSIKYDQKNKDIPYKARIDKTKKYLLSKGYSISDIETYFKSSFLKRIDESDIIKKDYDKLYKKCDGDINKIKISLYKKGYDKERIDEIC